jgi:TolA-binding protein
LQKRSAENVRLAQLHQQLTDLASRVMALSGYQDLTPDDGWVDPALLPTSRPAEP